MLRLVGVFVGLCALLQTQQPPVFRSGVTAVNVDVYPRRDGRVVEGLRLEDFQVFEDGKPQKVETLEFVRIEPNPVDSERRDPNTKAEGDEIAADPHNRVFVVYLDIYHTTFAGAHEARRPLIDFLNRMIGARDVFAVLTPEMPVRQMVFGRRTDTLQTEMTQHFDWGLDDRQDMFPRTPQEERLYPCINGPGLLRLHREDTFMSSLEELMVRLSVLRDERKNLILISEGWIPRPPGPMQTQGAPTPSPIPRIGATPGGSLGDVSIISGGESASCSREAARLAAIDFDRRFRDLLALAQRSNVSFYPVDVGGLKTFAPTASMRGIPGKNLPSMGEMRAAGQGRIDTLMTLADNTDGRAVVNTNGIDAGFRRIADDLSAYYLLGYASTNVAHDGKYRRIEVKVNQPKLSVTARRGYLAPSPDATAMAAASAAAVAVPSPIADELGRLARLRRDAELFGHAVRTPSSLTVVAEISSPLAAGGRWNEGADVRVAIPQTGGDPIIATGRIEPGARGAVLTVPLPAGAFPQRATITVTGPAGSIDTPLEIPGSSTEALVGDPVGFRGTSAPRVPLRPIADFQLRRTERLHVEWSVLKPLDQRSVRVLDRRGQPLALNVTVAEPSSIVTADVLLAPLAEGDYVLELTAGAGAQTERRLMAFRVVR